MLEDTDRPVLEVEVIGVGRPGESGPGAGGPGAGGSGEGGPDAAEVRRLAELALASAGIADGHLAVQFVGAERIRELNRDFRDTDAPTDVLSFGIDEDEDPLGPRELGDVFICSEHTVDVREAVLHGALHVTGMDHESDEGEMLALQAQLLCWATASAGVSAGTA